MLFLSQISLKYFKKDKSAGRIPPSPCTGSTIIPAVFLFIADLNLFLLLNSTFLKPGISGANPFEYFLFFCADKAPNVRP